jgi:hypothetical protein
MVAGPMAFAGEQARPRWWKGNLHSHTFWSDGDDFPEMVTQWYTVHGYHFLAFVGFTTSCRRGNAGCR